MNIAWKFKITTLNDMRTFLSRTAGATFYSNSNVTFNIKKDHFEIIFRLAKGTNLVILMLPESEGKVLLLTNWDQFFTRITNHNDPPKMLKMLEKSCPNLVRCFREPDAPVHFFNLPTLGIQALGMELDIPFQDPYTLLGNTKILTKASVLTNYIVEVYQEIMNGCPFDGWKKGLAELWG
jgi:hypothetical protein